MIRRLEALALASTDEDKKNLVATTRKKIESKGIVMPAFFAKALELAVKTCTSDTPQTTPKKSN